MDRKKQELLRQIKAYLRENDLNKMADFLNEMSYEGQYAWLINYIDIFASYDTPTKNQVKEIVDEIEHCEINSLHIATNIEANSWAHVSINSSSKPFKFLLGNAKEHLKSKDSEKAKFYYQQAKAIKESYNRKDVIIRLVNSFFDTDRNDTKKNSSTSNRGQHLKKAKIRPSDKFWKKASTLFQNEKEKCVTNDNKVTNFLVDTLHRKKFVGYNSDEPKKKIPLTKPTIRRRLNERLKKSGTLIIPKKHK